MAVHGEGPDAAFHMTGHTALDQDGRNLGFVIRHLRQMAVPGRESQFTTRCRGIGHVHHAGGGRIQAAIGNPFQQLENPGIRVLFAGFQRATVQDIAPGGLDHHHLAGCADPQGFSHQLGVVDHDGQLILPHRILGADGFPRVRRIGVQHHEADAPVIKVGFQHLVAGHVFLVGGAAGGLGDDYKGIQIPVAG